jgi:isopentenyl-diphosphate delta-isomerase
MAEETEVRKADHIRISLTKNVNSKNITTGLEDISLVHNALPEIDRHSIDLKTTEFKHEFAAPVIVGAITGGTFEAARINAVIAEAVEALGLGMGVGSQRAAIEERNLEKTFYAARKAAPNAFLIANIGGIQLVSGYGLKEVKKAIDMIDADAVAIHLNALQEAVQPEGQTSFKGILDEIRDVAKALDKPLIVKETGSGMASEEAKRLEDANVAGIDISGAGGTSWAGVESYRSTKQKNRSQRRLGNIYWDWGIPTAVSLVEVSRSVNIPVIASGGIRTGLDMAKTLSLGANLTSFSQPALHAAVCGVDEVRNMLSLRIEELKTAMFLVGAKSLRHMSEVPTVIIGKTAEWLQARGFDVYSYARRTRG